MATWTTHDMPGQSGRLAIVTGATGGLGLETALALAGAGAEVILAARNPDKGRAAEVLIRERHPGAQVRFAMLDLASLASVEAFAEQQLAAGRPIDILVNNAGVMAPPRRQTTLDGFELQLGTNYLSHFALTGGLLPLLIAARARVVQLSSIAHRHARIRLDDLNAERRYRAFEVYGQSKLAMLMFALELDRRSKAQDWGLTSVAAHPGIASTDLIDNGAGTGGYLFRAVSRLVVRLVGQSAEQGALPQLMAATMPRVTGGSYFGPQGWQEFKGPPGRGKIRPQALDAAVAAQLWSASQAMTGVAFG
jgi:NAD(P)-dependent dehydrogenase (short-subunit alcohol dehydrogenase family)